MFFSTCLYFVFSKHYIVTYYEYNGGELHGVGVCLHVFDNIRNRTGDYSSVL